MKTKMMSRHWSSVAGLALALVLQTHEVCAQPAASPERTGSEERRRALYQEGKDAIKAQRWVDARTRLSEAWAISPSYDVALLLAQAQFNLERFAEAATLLDYYFRNVPAKENEKTFANAKDAFAASKTKVSTVTVKAPDGAEVLLDGKRIGAAPLEAPVFVAPGKRVFEARSGDASSTQELQALAGQEQTVALEAPAPTSSAKPPNAVASGLSSPPPPMVDTAPDGPSIVPALVGGGVAVLGLGLGIGFRVAAGSSQDRFQQLQAENGAHGCEQGASTSSDCTALKDAVETTDFRRNFSTGAFVVGGVAAVGTAVYWFWPRSAPTTASGGAGKLRLNAHAGPGAGMIRLGGDF